jgi:hypothetical protein
MRATAAIGDVALFDVQPGIAHRARRVLEQQQALSRSHYPEAAGAHEGDGAMEITIHKHLIEQCVTMACASKAPTATRPFGSPWRNPGCGWLTRWSAPKWRTFWSAGDADIDGF